MWNEPPPPSRKPIQSQIDEDGTEVRKVRPRKLPGFIKQRILKVVEQPGPDLYPNASEWYQFVSSKLAASFPGKAVGVRIGSQAAAPAEAAPAKEAAKPADDEDDDDIDLFGDETEEEKATAEAREAAKKTAKKKESGKSYVLLDVKPWDDETDMKKLEEVVRSVELEGLLWGASKLLITL